MKAMFFVSGSLLTELVRALGAGRSQRVSQQAAADRGASRHKSRGEGGAVLAELDTNHNESGRFGPDGHYRCAH